MMIDKRSAYDFALKAEKPYKEEGFTMEQKFIFHSNAVVASE